MVSKKSSKVGLGLVSLVASMAISTAFVSCGSEESWDQYCVDKDNKVVDPHLCEQGTQGNNNNGSNNGVSPFYMWYFMSRGGGSGHSYPIGSTVTGGTYNAPSHISSGGTSQSPSKGTTSRGGFGKTGAGHSSSS